MEDASKMMRGIVLLWLTATLTGCGGGGGGGETPAPPTASPPPPVPEVASIRIDSVPTTAAQRHTVEFQATGSSSKGSATTLTWDYGDGSVPVIGAFASHAYEQPGSYVVTVTVNSSTGAAATETRRIEVHANSAPVLRTISAAGPVSTWLVGDVITFSTLATDADADTVAFRWDLGDGNPPAAGGSDVAHNFASAGIYRVRVVADDGYGGTASADINVTIQDPAPPSPPPAPPSTIRSWEQQGLPYGLSLMDTQWSDAQHGLILASDIDNVPGERTSVFKTQDGGATWERHLVDYAYATRLIAVDATTAFVAAAGRFEFVPDPPGQNTTGRTSIRRQIMKSTDGGITWRGVLGSSRVGDDIRDIAFTSPGRGWAVGWKGRLAKTEDGGESWTDLPVLTDQNLLRIQFVDADHGWVLCEPDNAWTSPGTRHVLHTVDGGATWTAVPLPGQYQLMRGISFSSATEGWILAGNNGRAFALQTIDGGGTWTVTTLPQGATGFARDVIAISATEAYVGDLDGDLWHTSDAGTTWTETVAALVPDFDRFPPVQTERFLRTGDKTFKVVGRNGAVGSVTLD